MVLIVRVYLVDTRGFEPHHPDCKSSAFPVMLAAHIVSGTVGITPTRFRALC